MAREVERYRFRWIYVRVVFFVITIALYVATFLPSRSFPSLQLVRPLPVPQLLYLDQIRSQSNASDEPTTLNSSHSYSQLLQELKQAQVARMDEGCSCPKFPGRSSGEKTYYASTLSEQSLKVRKYDVFRRWRQRQEIVRSPAPLALCPTDLPLQFVSSGMEIEPLQSIKLVGLAFSSLAVKRGLNSYERPLKVSFLAARNVGRMLVLWGCKVSVHLDGNNTRELSITSWDVQNLDAALECVLYQSTVSLVDEWETIIVRVLGRVVNIHIRIRRKPLPNLYRTSSTSPPIHERVTVVTKTFERYPHVNRLIESVSKFYPNMTIIVADDSVQFQTIERKNVMHYKMPAQAGWFAGRNLAVSQVATEYLLWVDDDFVFTEKTILQLFVDKLDRLDIGLDIVSGFVGLNQMCGTCLKVGMAREGYCITDIQECDYGPVPGYPQCLYVDRVVNFFMARTRSVQKIGFDPHIDHVGHVEFFMDGYHTLRSACCRDVHVNHDRGTQNYIYGKSRTTNGPFMKYYRIHNAFKYNVKCHAFI